MCMIMLQLIELETLTAAWLCAGAVLETIMAKMDGVQGDRISVGVSLRDLPFFFGAVTPDQETSSCDSGW